MNTGWIMMWIIAFGLFFIAKLATGWIACAQMESSSATRWIGYLFAWPGMNACRFFRSTTRLEDAARMEWMEAISRIILGVVLLFGIARMLPQSHPLLVGWTGMVGMVLLLHFGLFHLISLVWRAFGVDAPPIMNHPFRAISLSDFWSARWNMGFHQLAAQFVFKPLGIRFGATPAMLATFLLSGMVHDAVISIPAGAGFGLPTLYFVIQGAGILIERQFLRRRPLARRALAIALVALPLPLLFHAPFIYDVFLPFMQAIRAL